MSDEPKPSDDRNGCFLDKSWSCKVCDGEIPYGHLDHCDIWQLEKKHLDFIANEYNAVLLAKTALSARLARVTAERDRAREALQEIHKQCDSVHIGALCIAALAPAHEVSDGHGSTWRKCSHSSCDLQVVRPGRVQCSGYCA